MARAPKTKVPTNATSSSSKLSKFPKTPSTEVSSIDDIFAKPAKPKSTPTPSTSSGSSKVKPPQPVASFSSTSKDSEKKKKKKAKIAASFDPNAETPEPKLSTSRVVEVVDPSVVPVKPVETAPAVKKSSKRDRKDVEEDEIFRDSRGTGPRRKTEEGFLIYKEAELKIDPEAGGTPLCPFDCECCF